MSILAVGTLQPRKNLMRLIQAFERLAPRYPDIQLVLCERQVGAATRSCTAHQRHPFTTESVILATSPIAICPRSTRRPRRLPFHPFTKDLGCPRWKPWHAEPRSSPRIDRRYPKICGDAAILVDPLDPESIANGIELVLTDDEVRQGLTDRGFVRAAKFRWQECAEQTLAFLRSIGDN